MLPPVAIVWPCPLSVDAYAALGKTLEVPRPDCPSCARAMTFWSGYVRPVRVLGRVVRLFVRRARCGPCGTTHALLPAFVLRKRVDVVEVVGEAITAVVEGRCGVRPVAAALGVPHATARGWIRRFVARAGELTLAFAALGLELGGTSAGSAPAPKRALIALSEAFRAASTLPGWALLGRWRFCSAVSGGSLIAANTTSPYLVIGKRRFMPPVPFPADDKEPKGGT